MSADTTRKAYKYTCSMVRPQMYSEKSLMESVVDFFSDVVPQAYSGYQKSEDREKIQWVRFENCDVNDVAKNPDMFRSDTKGLPLLLILGYSNGVQIWHITPNGEAQEIMSQRQGPVRICRILPNPDTVFSQDGYTSKRPLAVICDSSSAGQPYCGVKFVSLKTGDEVHSISFKTLPVQNIECNKRFIVMVFLEKLCVHEACNFKQLFWITSCYPCPGLSSNPVALSTRWLAYADKRLVAMHQSCGGMSGDGSQSYAATVISAAKGAFKGLSMFGEAIASSVTGSKPSPPKRDYMQLDNGNRPGIVTVVDIQGVHNDSFNVNEDNEGGGLIAHFHAHANEPVSHMAFDPTGTLLVTACKLGHNFHVFRLMAHPVSSALGAVHHLYTLHRGETTAKVIDISLSQDSRWVTVSSHRGTTHLFPITTYGGPVNVRTHSQPHVVNRASRFHKSAGLDDIDHTHLDRRSPVLSTSPSHSGQYDRYPSLIQQNTLNNNMGNPRLPPYPHPITIPPAYQVKQPLNVVLNPANKNQSPSHSPTGQDNVYSVCAKFCTPRLCVMGSPKLDIERREGGKRPVDSLYVMAQSGTLVEYVLEPRARAPSDKITDDCMLVLNVAGRVQWNLARLKNSPELRPPLPSNSPLILAHEAVVSQIPTAPDLYDLPGLTRHDSRDSLSSDHSNADSDDQWLSQVEIITHVGPHRRLWMGPQFSFKTYQENTTVLSSQSSALLSQSPESNMAAMDIAPGDEGDLESLKLQPTRSNPVSMPNARPAYRRLSASDSSPSQGQGVVHQGGPLMIEAGSFEQSPHLLDVYSNWTESTVVKQPQGSNDLEEDRLKEIADAMVESPAKDMEKLSLRQHDLPRTSLSGEMDEPRTASETMDQPRTASETMDQPTKARETAGLDRTSRKALERDLAGKKPAVSEAEKGKQAVKEERAVKPKLSDTKTNICETVSVKTNAKKSMDALPSDICKSSKNACVEVNDEAVKITKPKKIPENCSKDEKEFPNIDTAAVENTTVENKKSNDLKKNSSMPEKHDVIRDKSETDDVGTSNPENDTRLELASKGNVMTTSTIKKSGKKGKKKRSSPEPQVKDPILPVLPQSPSTSEISDPKWEDSVSQSLNVKTGKIDAKPTANVVPEITAKTEADNTAKKSIDAKTIVHEVISPSSKDTNVSTSDAKQHESADACTVKQKDFMENLDSQVEAHVVALFEESNISPKKDLQDTVLSSKNDLQDTVWSSTGKQSKMKNRKEKSPTSSGNQTSCTAVEVKTTSEDDLPLFKEESEVIQEIETLNETINVCHEMKSIMQSDEKEIEVEKEIIDDKYDRNIQNEDIFSEVTIKKKKKQKKGKDTPNRDADLVSKTAKEDEVLKEEMELDIQDNHAFGENSPLGAVKQEQENVNQEEEQLKTFEESNISDGDGKGKFDQETKDGVSAETEHSNDISVIEIDKVSFEIKGQPLNKDTDDRNACGVKFADALSVKSEGMKEVKKKSRKKKNQPSEESLLENKKDKYVEEQPGSSKDAEDIVPGMFNVASNFDVKTYDKEDSGTRKCASETRTQFDQEVGKERKRQNNKPQTETQKYDYKDKETKEQNETATMRSFPDQLKMQDSSKSNLKQINKDVGGKTESNMQKDAVQVVADDVIASAEDGFATQKRKCKQAKSSMKKDAVRVVEDDVIATAEDGFTTQKRKCKKKKNMESPTEEEVLETAHAKSNDNDAENIEIGVNSHTNPTETSEVLDVEVVLGEVKSMKITTAETTLTGKISEETRYRANSSEKEMSDSLEKDEEFAEAREYGRSFDSEGDSRYETAEDDPSVWERAGLEDSIIEVMHEMIDIPETVSDSLVGKDSKAGNGLKDPAQYVDIANSEMTVVESVMSSKGKEDNGQKEKVTDCNIVRETVGASAESSGGSARSSEEKEIAGIKKQDGKSKKKKKKNRK